MPRLRHLLRLPTKLHRHARRNRLATLLALLSLALFLLIITPFYVIYKPPQPLLHYFQRRWPDVLWQVSTSRKVIALTIDDAPSEFTSDIQRTLTAYNASATFFVIGAQVSGRESVLADLVRYQDRDGGIGGFVGNELANHAMHDAPSRALTESQLTYEMAAVERRIDAAYRAAAADFINGSSSGNDSVIGETGRSSPPSRPKYFRPGSGFFSDGIRNVVKNQGYRLVLGSVYPHDAQIGWAWLNARHVLSMVRPGAIIVCHDRRSWTVPMLERVLPELKRRGYQVLTVSELLTYEGL